MIKQSVSKESDYRGLQIDSSSSLKEFATDRRKYKKKYIDLERVTDEEDSKASVTGRIVETLLFEKDLFDSRFYMSGSSRMPSGNMLKFVNALYKCTAENENNTSFEDCLKEAYKASEYKWTFDKVLEKFNGSDAEIYYRELLEVKRKGLTIVTLDDVTNAERVVQELKTNEFTAPVIRLIEEDNSRYEVLIQYQIDGYEVDGLKLKSMMDLVVIDHKAKTIQVYDLKVSWSVEGFYTEYYLYRLAYIQAYLYKEACREIKVRKNLEYYTVLDPKFIVCDSINYFAPLIYALDGDDMQDAYNGFEYKGKHFKGVKEIIKDLKWHKETNIWRISRINYENGGITPLKR